METTKPLYTKQRLFCYYMAGMEDPIEAAVRAGYSRKAARREVVRLLDRADVRAEIERCRREAREHRTDTALAGLVRLGLGEVNDVAGLVCRAQPPESEELAMMDLFALSELKKGKDGGLEVKLYDRMKALELLLSHQAGGEEAGSFYSALDAAVSGMSGAGGGDCAV
jgi:hypothetical protein